MNEEQRLKIEEANAVSFLNAHIRELERENAALREGSDAAGLSALADIREALGVGGRPCLFELAGLVREKVERVRELEAVAVALVSVQSGRIVSRRGSCPICGCGLIAPETERKWARAQKALSAAGYLKGERE